MEASLNKSLSPLRMAFLAVPVGVVAGLGAAAFRGLIAVFHNAFFLGIVSVHYDAMAHTPAGPWGGWIFLVPVVGAMIVAFVVGNFAPEAKGHGVPEVMDAVYYGKGIIRPIVALIKSVASAVSIGSGGSVGREGPIIQIGSAFGSSLGQILGVPPWQRITLIAAGAAGGLAATFNTPIGGILFASELLLHEVSARTLVPVAIATATASYVGRLFFGATPSFDIPAFEKPYFQITQPLVLVSYVGLGIIMGLVSVLFIRAIYGAEDFFDRRIKGNYYTRHMLGMLLVGVSIDLMMIRFGHYYVEGVSYATIQDVLFGRLPGIAFLCLLFILKLALTSLTLGSGASGGIFSPSLFLGATLAAAYGVLLKQLFPSLEISPPAFAVVGMAGIVGGATGAVITSIVMVFEMTRDYYVVVPMTITVAISYGIRKWLCKESIYTMKLARRGHFAPDALQANLHYARRAQEILTGSPAVLSARASLGQSAEALCRAGAPEFYLVDEGGKLAGVLSRERALQALVHSRKDASIAEFADQDFAVMPEDATLFGVIAAMCNRKNAAVLLAVDGKAESVQSVKGLISKENLGGAMIDSVELFMD